MWGAIEKSWQSCSAHEPALGDDIKSVSPITENMLEKSWKDNLKRGITWAGSLQQFDRESQRFARPALADEFPKKVQYQSFCGAFCRSSHGMKLVRMFQALLDEFSDVVRSMGSVAEASKQHVLLQFTVETGFDQKDFFAWLVAPSATSGTQQAQQIFVLCKFAGFTGEDLDSCCGITIDFFTIYVYAYFTSIVKTIWVSYW